MASPSVSATHIQSTDPFGVRRLGKLEAEPDGSPRFDWQADLFVGPQYVAASHQHGTISIGGSSSEEALGFPPGGAIGIFPCGPEGITGPAIEMLDSVGFPDFSPSETYLVRDMRIGFTNDSGYGFGVANLRTGERWHAAGASSGGRCINCGASLVALPSSSRGSFGITSSILGLGRYSSGALNLTYQSSTTRDFEGVIHIPEFNVLETRDFDLCRYWQAEDETVLRARTIFQIKTSDRPTPLRNGSGYFYADIITNEIYVGPLGAPVTVSGTTYQPRRMRFLVCQRKGFVRFLPDGTFTLSTMFESRYDQTVDTWVSSVGSIYLPGPSSWPAWPTTLPMTTLLDTPVPITTRLATMSDRIVEITGGKVRMWAYDGTWLGENVVPSGGPTSVLQVVPGDDLMIGPSLYSRDFGMTWLPVSGQQPTGWLQSLKLF